MGSDPAAGEGRVVVRPAPFNAETPAAALVPEITPPGLHYVRTNFHTPSLDARRHRIAVEGAVAAPLEVTAEELARLPARSVAVTLECAGNHRLSITPLPTGEAWGGGAVGTAVWGGVSLRDLLDRAGLDPRAREVLVEGADRGLIGGNAHPIPFARSLPLERALHPDTLLAVEMNGRPLPPEHGAPVRLVVPGWYGMASVKWVSRIEVLADVFSGFFQRERYVYDRGGDEVPEPVAAVRVKSVITDPADGAVLPAGPVLLSGWAWSGGGPVTRVEVAVEGGDSWREARVHPAPSPYLWQRWEYAWEASDPGRRLLRVRAHDAAGAVQPDAPEWNRLGYGANGARSVMVTVR